MILDSDAADILGEKGLFSQKIKQFRVREPQLALASAVEHAMATDGRLIGEAGTGVGKTYAYLVPVLRSDKKTIISTGTRYLQDQLYHKDLPAVCEVLGEYPDTALLKGRANYLCKERLKHSSTNPALQKPQWREALEKIKKWAATTRTGDIAECPYLTEESPLWQFVTSNDDFCSEHDQESMKGCFLQKARRRAQEAKVVVVNHHLLCADMALKEEGFGELLPEADSYVIDEAHQLPDVASSFFGRRLTSRQVLDLCRDSIGEQLRDAPDLVEVRSLAQDIEQALREFRLSLGQDITRDSWYQVIRQAHVRQSLEALVARIDDLRVVLNDAASRGRGLESCHTRAEKLLALCHQFLSAAESAQQTNSDVSWFETYRSGLALNLTPLDVAEPFQRVMALMPASWVFVSATLSAAGGFQHFERQLGLTDAQTTQLESPFDYQNNALLYLPPTLPETQSPRFLDALVEAAIPVIEAAGGRTFFLFTSHRVLNYAAAQLRERLDFSIFVQGETGKRELVKRFVDDGAGVLLGTASFWEGVDVRGDALSCVIIDKLPFASPGDPVLKARLDAMRRDGENPFNEYQVPQAIVALKQGVGRLIRDYSDRGVLMLCDPRLTSKPYGKAFLDSLPPMQRVRDIQVVNTFFTEQPKDASYDEAFSS